MQTSQTSSTAATPHPAASIMRYPMGYSPWHADISMEAGKTQNLA